MFSCTFWSNPVMSAATSMITLTPNTTPKTVSALRILCARKVSMACFKFSPYACAMLVSLAFRPQRFDGIELCRAHRGINPEEESHTSGKQDRDDHRAQRGLHGNRGDRASQRHQRVCEYDSKQSTDRCQDGRLGHELQKNMFLPRS